MSHPEGALQRVKQLDWALIHQAAYEIETLAESLEQLTKSPATRGWDQRVQRILSGHGLPQDEQRHSSARDIQFELIVAAKLKKAGYDVELSEPDVVVTCPEYKLCVAAKRPRSVKRLEKTIRKAAKQVEKSSLNGFVALNITLLQNPRNGFFLTHDLSEATQILEETTKFFWEKNAGLLRLSARSESTIGCVLYLSALAYDQSRSRLGYVTRWQFGNFCTPEDERMAWLYNMAERITPAVIE